LNETPLPGSIPRFEIPGWRERFGVVAGITGRGTGPAPFDLGLGTTEPVGEVMARWRALRAAEPGFSVHVLGNQVHGTRVRWESGRCGEGWLQVPGVDGHATAATGVMLYVTVADCIPVYLLAPGGRSMALLHAGWRGTAAGMLERGVEAMSQHSKVSHGEIVMHCGVGICGECYEVGPEVVAGLGLTPGSTGPSHADIRAVLADQATRLGITEVSISSLCSAHHRDRFFSHRASKGADGRMVAYLGRPA
jgi:copper oxidase (laccase) domain-containing protein